MTGNSSNLSPMFRIPPFVHEFLRWMSGPRPVFYLLPYFMGLLIAGTVAQKYIGLFPATHLFFNAFILWWGIIPIPAGATVLLLLFINLLLHFIRHSQWTYTQLGTTLAHLSVLVLLFGAAVMLYDKNEGFMILQPDTQHHTAYDYHRRFLTIDKNGQEVIRLEHADLRDDMAIPNAPFTVQSVCRNCTLDSDGQLHARDVQLDDEMNQMAVTIRAQDGSSIILTEFLRPNASHTLRTDEYIVRFQRQTHPLPFALELHDLQQSFYDGTALAKAYISDIDIIENGYRWPIRISMNKPFRYKGYTFYQSSVLQLGDTQTTSVLNVVKNSGWFFPYIASAFLFIGLGLHAWTRPHDHS